MEMISRGETEVLPGGTGLGVLTDSTAVGS
jgi:hypothetical protein